MSHREEEAEERTPLCWVRQTPWLVITVLAGIPFGAPSCSNTGEMRTRIHIRDSEKVWLGGILVTSNHRPRHPLGPFLGENKVGQRSDGT